jgi:eukaryotic-like serine/threonine-protein kinase
VYAAGVDPFGVVGTAIAGKYRVDRVIGEGGFGVVYAGFHQVIGQPVAIKLMKPTGGPEERPRNAEAFLREARVLFDLAHTSIVRLYDVGTTQTRAGEVPYVVLELIAGVSLAEEIRRRQRGEAPPFAAAELFAIFDGLLDGLATAHARGVVHRDLKPSNVMLTRDPAGAITAKVLDFGTARAGGPGASVGPGGFTPLYAAPEQWDARYGATGPATDVFAAGLLLAEAALLAPPLAGDGMAQIAGAAMDGTRRPSIAARRPDVPRDVDAVLLRATRPTPSERFADAAQMRAALRAAFGAPAPLAFTMAPPTPQTTGAPPPGTQPYAPYAPPTPVHGGAMIMVGGPPPARGLLTTNAPLQKTTLPSATPPSGPHPMSIVALVVGLCALAAVLAFTVVLVMVLRREREPAAAVAPPSLPPPPTNAPAATSPIAPATDPAHGGAPTHAGDAGAAPPEPTPTPKPGDLRVTIGVAMTNYFDAAELKRIGDSHRGEVVACYKETLAHDPRFRGTATVTVFNTLGAQDCTFDVRKDDEADTMCGCLRATISTWKIPRPNNVWGSALFEYVISLAP